MLEMTRTKSCYDEIIQEEFTYVFKTSNEVKDVNIITKKGSTNKKPRNFVN